MIGAMTSAAGRDMWLISFMSTLEMSRFYGIGVRIFSGVARVHSGFCVHLGRCILVRVPVRAAGGQGGCA
ncbi:MAG: hypothetical protein HOQ20_15775 [Bradyrhizobium sp.]|nr:hypothetical protein [Bradyrhizobium sp.]